MVFWIIVSILGFALEELLRRLLKVVFLDVLSWQQQTLLSIVITLIAIHIVYFIWLIRIETQKKDEQISNLQYELDNRGQNISVEVALKDSILDNLAEKVESLEEAINKAPNVVLESPKTIFSQLYLEPVIRKTVDDGWEQGFYPRSTNIKSFDISEDISGQIKITVFFEQNIHNIIPKFDYLGAFGINCNKPLHEFTELTESGAIITIAKPTSGQYTFYFTEKEDFFS